MIGKNASVAAITTFDVMSMRLEHNRTDLMPAEGMIVLDSEGRILFINPAAEAATGWRADMACGRHLLSLLPAGNLFLATLGHEIRSPLTTLDAAVRLLGHAGGDVGALQRMMSVQVSRLIALTDDLLDAARLPGGRFSVRTAPMDWALAVRSAVEAFVPLLRERTQELVLSAPDILVIEGDALRLGQVVTNLLGNASKYTPPGGRIEVTLERRGADAVLTVRDNGRGMREPDRIFEPFVQEQPGAGLGIGLALVKRVVELHLGSVSAQSAGPGLGSAFTVRLPAHE